MIAIRYEVGVGMQSTMKRSLCVVDPDTTLPHDLLERFERFCVVLQTRSHEDAMAALGARGCSCVLIAEGGASPSSMDLARRIKEVSPGTLVLLLAPRTSNVLDAAFRAGVDVVLDSHDLNDLYTAIVTRIPPVSPIS